MLGHHDRMGPDDLAHGKSWNAAHPSRGGCGQEALSAPAATGSSTASPRTDGVSLTFGPEASHRFGRS